MTKILLQLQLSNYDTHGKFILEADSGYQMMINRARVMLDLLPDLEVDILCPLLTQCKTYPFDINRDLFRKYYDRIKLRHVNIMPNALATRYDFNFEEIAKALELPSTKYDIVYINDPMLLRNYKALFLLKAGYRPKFVVHSHFVDDPACPKFPTEASLWLGQVEAALKADYNFWQCESAMNVFFEEMGKMYLPHMVDRVRSKSAPWDDGYSAEEINVPVWRDKIRFDVDKFDDMIKDKVVVFVPNRIGGRGRSSDYTNCGKFMFDLLPELHRARVGKGLNVNTDFVVVAGNPSQKFLNHELEAECEPYGYINLVPDALNRDEFRYVAKKSHITLGLYNQDTYGGTVARECIELGSLPMWCNNYEYAAIAREAKYPFLCSPDFFDFVPIMSDLIDYVKGLNGSPSFYVETLRKIVRERCAYELTTPAALVEMGLLDP